MKVSRVKELVRRHGGTVHEVGYETYGDYKKAFVYAQFDGADQIPSISELDADEDVSVNTTWDESNNMVLYEVVLSHRDTRL
jgi:hypothetical protein